MIQKLRNRQRGFTLIELLIVVAIIGIIAAILIPNLLDAYNKSKQKRTMADVRTVGTALMQWLTDAASGSAAGRYDFPGTLSSVGFTEIEAILQPSVDFQYIQDIPVTDGWRNPLEFALVTSYNDPAQRRVLFGQDVMAIRSTGRDGIADGTTYAEVNFIATDYDQDIVWANGGFVHSPAGTTLTPAP